MAAPHTDKRNNPQSLSAPLAARPTLAHRTSRKPSRRAPPRGAAWRRQQPPWAQRPHPVSPPDPRASPRTFGLYLSPQKTTSTCHHRTFSTLFSAPAPGQPPQQPPPAAPPIATEKQSSYYTLSLKQNFLKFHPQRKPPTPLPSNSYPLRIKVGFLRRNPTLVRKRNESDANPAGGTPPSGPPTFKPD